MEYKIVYGQYGDGLTKNVQEHLAEGWKLYGHPYANSSFHYQAMIREDKKFIEENQGKD